MGLRAEARADRLGDALGRPHWQHAKKGGIDEADLRVRLGAEIGRGAEQLGLADDLGMDFKAHDEFPGAGGAFVGIGSGCLLGFRTDRRHR